MQLFLTILHVLLCFALILIILLQPGKEGAAVFGGGGGNQMYGPRGQGNFLGRATTVIAGLFMVTSITLAYRSSERTQSGTGDIEDVMRTLEEEEAAGTNVAPPVPAPPAPDPLEVAPPDPTPAPPEEGATPTDPAAPGTAPTAPDEEPSGG